MATKMINDDNLFAIANAIREKNGTVDTYKPSEMAPAIANIPTGSGGYQPLIGSAYDKYYFVVTNKGSSSSYGITVPDNFTSLNQMQFIISSDIGIFIPVGEESFDGGYCRRECVCHEKGGSSSTACSVGIGLFNGEERYLNYETGSYSSTQFNITSYRKQTNRIFLLYNPAQQTLEYKNNAAYTAIAGSGWTYNTIFCYGCNN